MEENGEKTVTYRELITEKLTELQTQYKRRIELGMKPEAIWADRSMQDIACDISLIYTNAYKNGLGTKGEALWDTPQGLRSEWESSFKYHHHVLRDIRTHHEDIGASSLLHMSPEDAAKTFTAKALAEHHKSELLRRKIEALPPSTLKIPPPARKEESPSR